MIDKERLAAVIQSLGSDAHRDEDDECPLCMMCRELRDSDLWRVCLQNILSGTHPMAVMFGVTQQIADALNLGFIVGRQYTEGETMEKFFK